MLYLRLWLCQHNNQDYKQYKIHMKEYNNDL